MSINVWNSDVYDDKLHFVSRLGKGILELLQPKEGEEILDLGCGTGDLSKEIAKTGAVVTGIDASSEMIKKARVKFSGLNFHVADAVDYRREEKFDAVFSNAALHWMKQSEKVVKTIEQVLKPNGRFVAEFGGAGNVQTIVNAIQKVLQEKYSIDSVTDRNPWYFPSIGEYSSLLEKHGFHVTYACLFDRPTTLPDGEEGLTYWLDSFADDFFPDFSPKERKQIYVEISKEIEDDLFIDGNWVADYKRLQIIAIKK
ncbi:class I SAM-dependent methyltransferase [Pseudogracilibacillus sp. SE30717A]|uniref:class I SAM-dependent methyltransferase n=1 Tax=Pseudogracilibacillus sp. SE30717A TaxID=3098293 RepID=UPI00300E4982